MSYTKAQYIERFGEDYWYSVVLPRMRKATAKYKASEKGKQRKYEYNRSEEGRTSFQKYANSEHGKEVKKQKQKRYNATRDGKAITLKNRYINLDREKGFNTSDNITEEYIQDNILNSTCIYCGDSDWTHLGADRIDNSKPHTPDNCVCACGICNCEREGRKMSVPEFVEYRKNHPRFIDLKPKVVEVDGIKVIKKP